MKKFEYKVRRGYYLDQDRLNELGLQGWELVSYNSSNECYIFKKRITMRIGFTGTRDIKKISKERVQKLHQVIVSFKIDYDDDLSVAHGCAVGADSLFHSICQEEVIPIIGRPSYTNNLTGFEFLHPPEAPLTRNKKIVDDCDVLIALPINPEVEELRSGTWSTIRYAKKQGKQIIII